jgi:hypothetical protein
MLMPGLNFSKGGATMKNRGKVRFGVMILWFGVVLVALMPGLSGAIPQKINYQGYLTTAAGVPVNGSIPMIFSIYDVAVGGTPLWTENHTVAVANGVYDLILGEGSPPVPINLTFDAPYYLGVTVGTDPEMTPRKALTSMGYAFRAQTVESIGSHTHSGADITSGTILEPRIDSAIARASALTSHTSNMSNPHSTTAAQVGAAPTVHIHSGNDITTGVVAEARIDPLIARDSEVSAAIASHNHDDRYYNKAYVNALEARIAALEAKLSGLTRSGNDFVITNANLYIQSGSGATDGALNGKGNLIVGYNELRGTGDLRTGSHNLIVGKQHNYSSYGGIVVGYNNTISGTYSSVSGGSGNTASGDKSSVSGGVLNTASSYVSSVSGGDSNTASGWISSISGGQYNTAGGYLGSSVSGGQYNTASGLYSSVSGGRYNTASGDYSFVAGGGSDGTMNYGNTAFAHYSAILGGFNNKAGDPALVDHNIGLQSTVSGGEYNTASGYRSSISGGMFNNASHEGSSVSGGSNNTASGMGSSVSGGAYNTASGLNGSSVSGGDYNTASGSYSSVSGGYSGGAHGDDTSVSGGFDNHAYGQYSSISGGSSNSTADTANAGSVSGGFSRSVTGWADWRAGGYFQTD